MVVFINGKSSPSHYRIFKIKQTKGPNDFAMIREVIARRITHHDKKFGELPDLFLIDGGPIQLKFAKEALEERSIFIPVISLAKREEWIYQENSSDPICLEKTSEILKLFQRIRDEAHRFAKRHFTELHRKAALSKSTRKKSD
jgi:excinuclease ABC subunit C